MSLIAAIVVQPEVQLNRERRVDWARMLSNLQRTGMSLRKIADELGVGAETLRGYMSEDLPSEPGYWIGHRLISLWCARTGCSLEHVPVRTVQLTVSQMLKTMS